jgi:hypothetical protein
MEALRRVGLGLLAAPEVRKEEDALNLALALSLSEQEQRLRTPSLHFTSSAAHVARTLIFFFFFALVTEDEQDEYDTLLCGMSALDPIAEVCGASSTTTSTSATDPRPRPPRSPRSEQRGTPLPLPNRATERSVVHRGVT